ncbi:MAG: GDP-mannose 4,6-dehydratase, partial [Calditrichia bacterium]
MADKVLITGGAGFIGSHLADELLANGYQVRILDNLSPQVHGHTSDPPDYLNKEAEFMLGDVRDSRALTGA